MTTCINNYAFRIQVLSSLNAQKGIIYNNVQFESNVTFHNNV